MKQNNILQLLEAHRGDSRPIIHFQQHSLTYEDLWQESQAVAQVLQSTPSTSPHLVIFLEHSPQFLFAYFGALMAGFIPVLVSNHQQLAVAVEHLEIQQILTAGKNKFYARIYKTGAMNQAKNNVKNRTKNKISVLDFHQLMKANSKMPVNANLVARADIYDREDICSIHILDEQLEIREFTHGQLLLQVENLSQALSIQSSDRLAATLNWCTNEGLVLGVFWPLYAQAPLLMLDEPKSSSDYIQFMQKVSQDESTVLCLSDRQMKNFVNQVQTENIKNVELRLLRHVLVFGDLIQPETCQRFSHSYRPWGLRAEAVIPMLGFGTTGCALAISPRGRRFRKVKTDFTAGHVLSFGSILPGLEIRIIDEQENILPAEQAGSIQYRWLQTGSAVQLWQGTGERGFVYQNELYVTERIAEKNRGTKLGTGVVQKTNPLVRAYHQFIESAGCGIFKNFSVSPRAFVMGRVGPAHFVNTEAVAVTEKMDVQSQVASTENQNMIMGDVQP